MGNIKDKVAIVGMGCTPFGELWDKGFSDLVIDSAYEAFEDAGVGPEDIEAAFISNLSSGMMTGAALAEALQFDCKPVTRIENNCASAADCLRVGAFSVASGMYDTVLCLGAEKSKDYGSGALEVPGTYHPITVVPAAPASFAKAAVKYFLDYGLSREEGKRTMAKIAVKNHYNGSLHPKAHFRRAILLEAALNAPIIAWPLGLFDCCPVTDGAAAAIITRADRAKKFKDDYILIKGMGLAIGRIDPYKGKFRADADITFFNETAQACKQAFDQVGVKNPRKEISIAEVHDCFSITEMLIYESMGLSPIGKSKADVDAGTFTIKGDLPVNPDGGLKSFGHPIGASGLRMITECYNQIRGKAGPRQKKEVNLCLAHCQGGVPGMMQASCMIVGPRD